MRISGHNLLFKKAHWPQNISLKSGNYTGYIYDSGQGAGICIAGFLEQNFILENF